MVTRRGTSHADTLIGTAGPDLLYGFQGDDRLIGSDGNDGIFGGAGHDRIHGMNGDDTIVTLDRAHDLVWAGNGDDQMTGRNDLFDGGAGNDYLDMWVLGTKSVLKGGSGDDTFALHFDGTNGKVDVARVVDIHDGEELKITNYGGNEHHVDLGNGHWQINDEGDILILPKDFVF